jgi:hypothetical protein
MMNGKTALLICVLAFVAIAMGIITAHAANTNAYAIALQTFPISVQNWIPLAVIVVLSIILIAALVYALSGLASSHGMRAWSINQIYEGIISLIMLFIFAFFAYLFFLNPVPAFTTVNLVPTSCSNAVSIYTLSACDISVFNADAWNLSQSLYYISWLTGIIPGISISVSFPDVEDIGVSATLGSFVPAPIESMFATAFSLIVLAVLLNQVQVILITGALLFLSLFIILGLIARSFGVTRSFGGAMLALGLGLGLIYPLITAITYGFITYHICNFAGAGPLAVGAATGLCTNGVANVGALTGNIVVVLIQAIFTAIQSTSGAALLIPNAFAITAGYIIAGLTVIPLLNFAIVDTFVIDFSTALGQQVDFLSLLSSLT